MNKQHLTLAIAVLLTAPAALTADSPLHDAICSKDMTKVKSILAQGVDVNASMDPKYQSYPLALASYCYGGAPEIAGYLLDRGAKVNLHAPDDYTSLMWVLRSFDSLDPRGNNVKRALALRMIRMGAEINYQQQSTGRTALMVAAGTGDEEVVNALLSKGADRSPRTKTGWCIDTDPEVLCNAADYARMGGYVELAMKIEGKDPAPYKKTLHYAVKQGDMARIESLLQAGADVNQQEPVSKMMPLSYAVKQGRIDIVRRLLARGANPDIRQYAGTTVLTEAVQRRNVEMAKALIDGGAKAGIEQTQGCGSGLTAFGWAVEYDQEDIARYMIERKSLDPANPGKAFMGLYGRHAWNVGVTQLLLDKGGKPVEADVNALKLTQERNAWLAEAGHIQKIIALLEAAMNRKPDPEPSPSVTDTSDELPDDADLGTIRARGGIPPGVKTRSLKKPHPRVETFDSQSRDAKGNLIPNASRGRY